MNKLFKDYLPYLVEIEEPKRAHFGMTTGQGVAFESARKTYLEKRYPTRALRWKKFEDEKPKMDSGIFIIDSSNERPIPLPMFWEGEILIDPDRWIKAEVYEAAKEKEDMWLPLGGGWMQKELPSYARFDMFYHSKLNIEIYHYKNSHIDILAKKELSRNTITIIPIEICTLEIIQKIIEEIKRL